MVDHQAAAGPEVLGSGLVGTGPPHTSEEPAPSQQPGRQQEPTWGRGRGVPASCVRPARSPDIPGALEMSLPLGIGRLVTVP